MASGCEIHPVCAAHVRAGTLVVTSSLNRVWLLPASEKVPSGILAPRRVSPVLESGLTAKLVLTTA